MKILKFYAIFLLLVGALAGCSKNDSKKETSDKDKKTPPAGDLSAKGKEVFYAESEHTGLKCADCHSDGTNSGNPLVKYFSDIRGASKRPATYHGLFKGGDVPANAGGGTRCWKEYLGHEDDPMPKATIDALNAYYESLQGGSTDEVKYETIALPERDKAKLKTLQDKVLTMQGNVENGKKLFGEACSSCHSADTKVKNVPNLSSDYEGNEKGIIYNVKFGHDQMPFYRDDKLTDQDLADIAAFVMSFYKK